MNTQDLSVEVPKLLRWARKNGRRPPWRSAHGAYPVAVAEVLLQKTKATEVEPVWAQLIARFTTAESLADASANRIHRIVAVLGLGTQRTARLKGIAKALRQGGLDGPGSGLGPYGLAVASLSAGRQPSTVPVDGNVARVVSRFYGFRFRRGEPRKKLEVKAAVERLLDAQRRPEAKLRVLYALVDLGAAVCKPGRPACEACPLFSTCEFSRTSGRL